MSVIATFPAASGPMADKVRSFDWDATPLGPTSGWPIALRISVDGIMSSRFPKCLFWGDALIAIYNDAFVPLLGGKANALGQPFRTTWSETWDTVEPIVNKALSGEAAFFEDLPLQMDRTGTIETAYFTFCYSPVRDENGAIRGILDTVIETTDRVLADRAIAHQQARQRQLLLQMPGFVAVLSGPDHVFDYVNDAYVAISGPRNFIGRTVREVFPELAGQGFYELLDQVYATGTPFMASAAPIDLVDGQRSSTCCTSRPATTTA